MKHFSGKDDGSEGPVAGARVLDAKGQGARIVAIEQADSERQARIGLEDGMQILVSTSLLALQEDGVYRLPFRFDIQHEPEPGARISIPLLEERVNVARRTAATGRGVRIRKSVVLREQVVEEPLRRDELRVEHVPVGQLVTGPEPAVRYEGDTVVVPVLEEVLQVQKKLWLKEEIRITRRQCEERQAQTVSLRSEQISVERFDESG